jgi:geranylgeranyl reductase family protein
MDYDVIVVGGGPSGSVAAAYLARNGVKILLLDRKVFPRDKTCGDAVPTLALDVFKEIGLESVQTAGFFKADRVLHRNAENQESVFDLSDSSLTTSVASTCWIAPRYLFDRLLFDHALASGAIFEQCSVTAPLIENGQVVGVSGTQDNRDVTYRAKMVIAADGATSAVARAFNSHPKNKKLMAVSIRGYIETDVDLGEAIEIDFLKETLPGYAWLFPTGKRSANIGLGMRADFYDRQQYSLEELLEIYRNKPQIISRTGLHPITDIKSWQLPFFSFDLKRVFSGALLAGDAGHFINPITGDGIYEAIVTGKCAAQSSLKALEQGDFSEACLSSYNTLWFELLGERYKQATTLNKLLTLSPNLVSLAVFRSKEHHNN